MATDRKLFTRSTGVDSFNQLLIKIISKLRFIKWFTNFIFRFIEFAFICKDKGFTTETIVLMNMLTLYKLIGYKRQKGFTELGHLVALLACRREQQTVLRGEIGFSIRSNVIRQTEILSGKMFFK